MSQLEKVTFELRVLSEQQFKDVVIIMTSAANSFFNATHTDEDDDCAAVRDHKSRINSHPTEMSKVGKFYCNRMRSVFKVAPPHRNPRLKKEFKHV